MPSLNLERNTCDAMKEGWTYKRIGEICSVVGGATPKTEVKEFWGGSNYWITPADLNGNKYQGATSRTITDLAVQKTNLQLLPTGTVLLSSRAPIGKVAITTTPMYCNQGFKNIICPDCLLNEFVYWYLLYSKDYLNSLGTGATFKEISKKTTESIQIPLPPLDEQERIVAELDLLTGIIDKQEAQLKELDTLAQSIFYDMFGNPIENDKRWDMKKLCEVGKVITGSTPSTRDEENYSSNDYCFVKPSDIEKDSITLIEDTEYHISKKAFNNSRQLPKGSILTTCIGIIGKVGILQNTATCNQQINAIIPASNILPSYLAFAILSIRNSLESMANAPVVPIINKGDFSKISIPLPPLNLQESFALKIAVIETNKRNIRRSIDESQKLFDYTMNKYFG